MMIKVTVSNNVKRETTIVESSSTIREVLEAQGIDYARGGVHLDGAALMPGDMDKTFDSFGITDRCFLSAVLKADNA